MMTDRLGGDCSQQDITAPQNLWPHRNNGAQSDVCQGHSDCKHDSKVWHDDPNHAMVLP